MIKEILLLDTIDKVREFVDIANNMDCQINLKAKDIIVDAKSIMSVFGIDLTKPIEMEADCKCGFELLKQIDEFIYKK